MTNIPPTAIVDATAIIEDGATIAPDVRVGAYCHVGARVTLEAGVVLHSHVVVAGDTTVGAGTEIYPFASIGHAPQDLKFEGEDSRLIIGKNNTIREHVTINPGTKGDRLETVIGDNNLLMVGVHIAHDSVIGNHCVFANNSGTAGHVVVEDYVVMGFMAGVHQFVRIGRHAMIGAQSFIGQDVLPYTTILSERDAKIASVNLIGMKRRGFSKDSMKMVRGAIEILGDDSLGTWEQRTQLVAEKYGDNTDVQHIIDFVSADSSRGFIG